MPRKVVLFQMLSLDGVAEEPSDWLTDTGPELFALVAKTIETQDDVLLGRGTYDYWVPYWPTSDVQPFASFINRVRKHVVTSSEPTEQWANSTFVTENVEDYVNALKNQPGGDIGIHGSIRLARSLIRARLVDELWLIVASAIAGRGERLFADDDAPDRLELVESERTPSGTLFLHYRRA